ncbi:MAG TPA: Tad domain-containing protein, partial [Microthrixaceae bacterium]|nr:Tad domain-containing protein [Microthrixaceae bacterium]
MLTSIVMIVLMAFCAFAVDIGQRNQQLAGAQHAIDAAVITAAQYLSEHDGDYAGASARVKEIIRQNLGIDPASWPACDDPNHLDVSAPNGHDLHQLPAHRRDRDDPGQERHPGSAPLLPDGHDLRVGAGARLDRPGSDRCLQREQLRRRDQPGVRAGHECGDHDHHSAALAHHHD